MKKIMIILIPLILIACTTNNADYVTKQEFDVYKSSMENLIQASNDSINKTQKEILSKTDDHQLNINTLTIDLNSLYQTVSTAQKYEENDVLKKLVGKVAVLEYELEQFKNNNSSAEHTHSSVPSHTHTASSSTSIPSHTHTSIPNHTHTASTSSSVGNLDSNLLRQIMCVSSQNYHDLHQIIKNSDNQYIRVLHDTDHTLDLIKWRAVNCGTFGVQLTDQNKIQNATHSNRLAVFSAWVHTIDYWWK